MLARLGLAAVALFASLGALEVGIRVAGLELHHRLAEMAKYGAILEQDQSGHYTRHPPGSEVVLQGVRLRFNSLGMRDVEPAARSTKRVLVLGDSVVVGPGVPQDGIYPARLRALLADDGVDVVTGAVAGWNTIAEEQFLATHIRDLAPDVIALLYVVNDNALTLPFDRLHEPPRGPGARLHRTLLLESRLYEWAVWTYRTRRPDRAALALMTDRARLQREAGEPFAPDDHGWHESRAALGRMNDLAARHGSRFVVFLFRFAAGPLEQRAWGRLREFGIATGVPVFDTLPFFAWHAPRTLMLHPLVDPHPNARGHALLAAGVARTLRAAARSE